MLQWTKALLLPAILALATAAAPAGDLLPVDHGLRYIGTDGSRSVRVEVTLRAQPDGTLEYVEWVMPEGWARWFTRNRVRRSVLAYVDEWLQPRSYDPGAGALAPPASLPRGALDEFAVRLRARADIARGRDTARYQVWREDGSVEEWRLEVVGPETVETPDGQYQAIRFRLGTSQEWLEGWAAPLLVFHFVRLELWRDGRQQGELVLDEKQL